MESESKEEYLVLREEGLFTDITVVIRDTQTKKEKSFAAHRVILAAEFEFFDKLLRGTYKDSNKEIITLEMDMQIFEIMLDHVYQKRGYETMDAMKSSRGELLYIKGAKYLGLKNENLTNLLRAVTLDDEILGEYIAIVDEIFGLNIDSHIIDNIARYITVDYDLTELSDDLIVKILRSRYFFYYNIIDVYNMVKDLVEAGHDGNLFMLFDYSVFPEYIRNTRSFEELNHKRPQLKNDKGNLSNDLLPDGMISTVTENVKRRAFMRLVVMSASDLITIRYNSGVSKNVYICVLVTTGGSTIDGILDSGIAPRIGDIVYSDLMYTIKSDDEVTYRMVVSLADYTERFEIYTHINRPELPKKHNIW